jgi:hypothetical protein
MAQPVFNSGFAESSTEGGLVPRIGMEPAPSIIESESHFVMNEFEDSDDEEDDDAMDDSPIDVEPTSQQLLSFATPPAENFIIEEDETEEDQRNVRAKLSHPSSPRSPQSINLSERLPESASGSKMNVVVKDVAYNTYFGLLYYVSWPSCNHVHFLSPISPDIHRHYRICTTIFFLHISAR